MVIELAGVPGGGKSTLARAWAARGGVVVALPMLRGSAIASFLAYAVQHPVHAFWTIAFTLRHHAPGLLFYSLHLVLRALGKLGIAERTRSGKPVLVDEGPLHLLSVLAPRALSMADMRYWLARFPKADATMLATSGSFHRFHREDEHVHPRIGQGSEALASWEEAVRANVKTLEAALKEEKVEYAVLTENAEPVLASLAVSVPKKEARGRGIVIAATFAVVALCGITLSVSAPYIKSDDEQVYLAGALQAREGILPDADMLEGYEYGPYLYPKVLAAAYEPMGHDAFKATYLIALIFATGLAAYAAFRLIGLAWIPSLALSVVALMPRASAGTEIFGAFTFREAIGREAAMPLFWVASGLALARVAKGRALWPVFVLIGLFLFLHPVTVTLFAFLLLLACGVAMLSMRIPLWHIVRELFVAGTAYIIAGFYFFIKVFERLAPSGIVDASQTAYVDAILFRNAWEFPTASLDWYVHIAIVSAPFVALLAAYFFLPYFKKARLHFPFPNARLIVLWGVAAAVLSLVLALVIPGANLYAMQHFDASYSFQQWSRISKFYYLGLFIALVPAASILWNLYKESVWRGKRIAALLVIAIGLASSTIGFEQFQFLIGYQNYEKAYVPQAWSGVADSITPADYRETCATLKRLGATQETGVVSNDFGLRYYCRADLYVTHEEGAAYTYRSRAELVNWHERFLAQRAALSTRDPVAIKTFAQEVGARFIVLYHTEESEEVFGSSAASSTKAHLILDASPKGRSGIR